jgi:hypothetical protein
VLIGPFDFPLAPFRQGKVFHIAAQLIGCFHENPQKFSGRID